MNISVKLAMLSSLFFICGMSYLIDQVARPVVADQPLPLRRVASALPAAAVRALEPPAARPLARFVEAPPAPLVEAPVYASAHELVPPASTPEPRQALPPVRSRLRSEVPVAVLAPGAEFEDRPATARATGGDAAPSPAPAAPPGAAEVAVAAGDDGFPREYVVRDGDRLVDILRGAWPGLELRGVEARIALVMDANPGLSSPHSLRPGDRLLIPAPDADVRERRFAGAGALAGPRVHVVQPGETLRGIARNVLKDERRWLEIRDLNNVVRADRIQVGVELVLPPGDS